MTVVTKSTLPSDLVTLQGGLGLGDIQGLAQAIANGQGFFVNGGLTASTTQTQAGGTKLQYGLNSVASANASDAVTMPKGLPGSLLILANHSGQTIQLFPFKGDALNAAGADAAVTVATATTSVYVCVGTATQWWGGAITNEA